MRKALPALAAICVMGTVAAADAHHSPAMFDPDRRRVLTGTVRQFQWTNPHCYLQLLVTNEQGKQEEWSLEMGAPIYLYGRGWRRTTVKPGDQLRVTVAPLRKGGQGGLVIEVTDPLGKPLAGTTA